MTQRPATTADSMTASLLSVPIRRQRAGSGTVVNDGPALPASIIEYWRSCGSGPLMPAVADIDRDAVARQWPNTLLVAGRGGRFQFEERIGAPDVNGNPDIGTMAVEWILTLCEETTRRRTPLEKSDLFPTPRGDFRLHAVTLPLADDGVTVDHILCHLSRAA